MRTLLFHDKTKVIDLTEEICICIYCICIEYCRFYSENEWNVGIKQKNSSEKEIRNSHSPANALLGSQ